VAPLVGQRGVAVDERHDGVGDKDPDHRFVAGRGLTRSLPDAQARMTIS
jgi:hypothetical protein